MIYSLNDILMYLDDINIYVNSILYYHSCSSSEQEKLDLNEILMYLSSIEEIVQDIKNYLNNNFNSNC